MHTQEKDGKVQVAVTLIWATTKVEKRSGAATRTTRRDILDIFCLTASQRCGWWEGSDETVTPHISRSYHFEGWVEPVHVMRFLSVMFLSTPRTNCNWYMLYIR
jgi:hypothetical protein